MLKREKLLDILKTRFDYYAAQAVYNDLIALVGRDVDALDASAIQAVTDFLSEKVPGTAALVEKLKGFAAEAPAPAPVAEPVPEPAPEAPAAEEAPVEAPAKDTGKKKKK